MALPTAYAKQRGWSPRPKGWGIIRGTQWGFLLALDSIGSSADRANRHDVLDNQSYRVTHDGPPAPDGVRRLVISKSFA